MSLLPFIVETTANHRLRVEKNIRHKTKNPVYQFVNTNTIALGWEKEIIESEKIWKCITELN